MRPHPVQQQQSGQEFLLTALSRLATAGEAISWLPALNPDMLPVSAVRHAFLQKRPHECRGEIAGAQQTPANMAEDARVSR